MVPLKNTRFRSLNIALSADSATPPLAGGTARKYMPHNKCWRSVHRLLAWCPHPLDVSLFYVLQIMRTLLLLPGGGALLKERPMSRVYSSPLKPWVSLAWDTSAAGAWSRTCDVAMRHATPYALVARSALCRARASWAQGGAAGEPRRGRAQRGGAWSTRVPVWPRETARGQGSNIRITRFLVRIFIKYSTDSLIQHHGSFPTRELRKERRNRPINPRRIDAPDRLDHCEHKGVVAKRSRRVPSMPRTPVEGAGEG